jgi:hypothetical protein
VKLSPLSVHALYVVLWTAINWGVKKGYLAVGSMLRTDPQWVPKAEITLLTPAQTPALLAAASLVNDVVATCMTPYRQLVERRRA